MKKEEREKWIDIINDFEHDFMAIIAYQLTQIATNTQRRWITVDRTMGLSPIGELEKADQAYRKRMNAATPAPDVKFIELPDAEGNVHHFHRHDLESYRDGHFSYKPQGGFKTILSAKDMEDIMGTTTPAPDVPAGPDRDGSRQTPAGALVDKVERARAKLFACVNTCNPTQKYLQSTIVDVSVILEDALAAFESGGG